VRPSEVLRHAERYLDRHGVESPRATAEVLLQHVLGTDRSGLYSRADGLSAAEARTFGRALCRRCTGTPLQHLTGDQAFRYLTLKVEPGVFIPRPETEVVVEAALRVLDGRADPVIVDLGTGTGAIALSLKHERPDATVHATDVSSRAAALARVNASRLEIDVAVHGGDLFEALPSRLRGRISLVVSNPPYVGREEYANLPPDVRADPEAALVGGIDVHRRLAEGAPDWLEAGGWLVMEIGAEQGAEVAGVLALRFADVRVLPDLAGRDRVVMGRLRDKGGVGVR
jgi:release factor glutamine methyltransferase